MDQNPLPSSTPFLNLTQQPEFSPENMSPSTFSSVKVDGNKMALLSSSPKRRKGGLKRVVSVPIGDLDGSRLKGEGSPPSDSWAWRKYGQKPIKGSPYPRGYYRCSSSKGCPARKQVERSKSDPSMLIVTYACEHNHTWPVSRNSNAVAGTTKFQAEDTEVFPEIETEEKMEFEDGFLGSDGFCWFSNVNSPMANDGLFRSPICDNHEVLWDDKFGEDESFFADLGELPECSVVFQRGLVEMVENRGGITEASWCGGMG